MTNQLCYLQEDDPPEDHDIGHYSCVCGRCYAALSDLHIAAEQEVVALRSMLRECLKVVDDCYEKTHHHRVAKTSHQRLAIEAAIDGASAPSHRTGGEG